MANANIDLCEIGKRVRSIRKASGKTQASFANQLGISASYLALIEKGQRKPAIDLLAQVSMMCGISVDCIIFGKEEKEGDANLCRFEQLSRNHSQEEVDRALRLAEYYLKL